uniref:Fibroblast growth factor n=1 Tax=Labrus bergylta TaxID=56723 RepID=A0A3Q3GB76_9LABR
NIIKLLLLLLFLLYIYDNYFIISAEIKGANSSCLFYQTASGPLPVKTRVNQQLLYCRVGIGYHLQILPGGSVGGVHKPTEFCWLKVFAMKHGVVGIRGVKSGLYLCMNRDGQAYGEQFSDDCLLKENLEENHYTTYSSLSHPGLYLALSTKGELRKGNSVGRTQACTHFLPRKTPLDADAQSENEPAKPEESKPPAAPCPSMPITKVQTFMSGKTL